MRLMTLLLAAGLPGCAGWVDPTGALAAAETASVIVFGRGIIDIGVSAISGRDCSIVRLDRLQTYCAPIEVPVPQQFCTRSLGVVDCWADPALLPSPRQGVADGPGATPAQERYRAARWPKSVNGS